MPGHRWWKDACDEQSVIMRRLIAVADERIMEYNAAVETTTRWLGGLVASALDSRLDYGEFDSWQ